MGATAETASIERVIAIDARPETVWEFLVDPDKATRWMGLSASLDPRPGGLYRVEVVPRDTARGEFVEVDPPRRLVFTWGWESGRAAGVAPGSSTVEIELVPAGAGTTLRLRHHGVVRADDVAAHAHGWDHYLARLATAGSGGDPGPDPWLAQEPR